MKFLNKTNIMVSCLLILVYLVTHGVVNSLKPIEYYKLSLIPELTGMFLELFIVLVVFNKWQERLENQNKKEKERILRKYIIFIMKRMKDFNSVPSSFSFYAENHNENHAVLSQLRDEICDLGNVDIYEKIGDKFIRHCNVDIDAITALLPVASDLSKDHFRVWSRIVFYVKTISLMDISSSDNNQSKVEFKQHISKLVEYVKDFDDASFRHKIHNGVK